HRADAGVTLPLVADPHLALEVLRHDRVGLDPLAGAALVLLHRLVDLRRRVLAVVDRVNQRFRFVLVRRAEYRNARPDRRHRGDRDGSGDPTDYLLGSHRCLSFFRECQRHFFVEPLLNFAPKSLTAALNCSTSALMSALARDTLTAVVAFRSWSLR